MGSETCICDYTRDNDYENGKLIRNPACRAHPTPAPGPLDFEKAKRRPHAWSAESWLDRDTLTAQALAYGARCAAERDAQYKGLVQAAKEALGELDRAPAQAYDDNPDGWGQMADVANKLRDILSAFPDAEG